MIPPADTRSPYWLRAVLAATALVAVAVPALVVIHPPAMPKPAHERVVLPERRVVPPAELPPVDPVAFVNLAPEEARAFNAAVPFSTLPNPPARPFRFKGNGEDRARALDCMAAGILYEAGDDAEGERAVAQVVLNRLRHPAFPKTICGVIFDGEDRSTGCQFSFTCDHALTRWTPTADAWRRAREVAASALNGAVYKPVGYATHYHTDWVVPYWQASLDKVVAVHSHLFFRWTGWWGTPPAFNRMADASEPVIVQLAPLSDAHKTAAAMVEVDAALLEASAALGLLEGEAVSPDPDPLAAADSGSDSLLVTLPANAPPSSYPDLATRACGTRTVCKYSAWTDAAATPASLPLSVEQVAAMTFSYHRDAGAGIDKMLWNCAQTKRPDRRECMKQQVLLTTTPAAKVPDMLGGVRRRANATVQPAPKPGGGTMTPAETMPNRVRGLP